MPKQARNRSAAARDRRKQHHERMPLRVRLNLPPAGHPVDITDAFMDGPPAEYGILPEHAPPVLGTRRPPKSDWALIAWFQKLLRRNLVFDLFKRKRA